MKGGNRTPQDHVFDMCKCGRRMERGNYICIRCEREAWREKVVIQPMRKPWVCVKANDWPRGSRLDGENFRETLKLGYMEGIWECRGTRYIVVGTEIEQAPSDTPEASPSPKSPAGS